ncbi:CD8A protein, partial [Trogon melanurus]|nr:CD8A protein [Trogon melanurus]
MAGSPALLLLLALGLCCPGIHGQRKEMRARFYDGSTKHPRLGQRLELECVTFDRNIGASWVLHDKGGTLHFIAYISSPYGATYAGNNETSTRFEAWKNGSIYRLFVKSFTTQDEGNYFCLMNSYRTLYISRGQPVFLP